MSENTWTTESAANLFVEIVKKNRPMFIASTTGAKSGQTVVGDNISAISMGDIMPGETLFIKDKNSGIWYAYGASRSKKRDDRRKKKARGKKSPTDIEFAGCVIYTKREDKKTNIKPNHNFPFEYRSTAESINFDFWNTLTLSNLKTLNYPIDLPSFPAVTRGNAENTHLNAFRNSDNSVLNANLAEYVSLLSNEEDPWIQDGEGFIPTYTTEDLTLNTQETVVVKEPVLDANGNTIEAGKTKLINCEYKYKKLIYSFCIGSLVNVADPENTRTYYTNGIKLFLISSKCTETDDDNGEELPGDDLKLYRIKGTIQRRNLPITGGNQIIDYCNVKFYSSPKVYNYGSFKYVADDANYRNISTIGGDIFINYKASKSTWRFSEDQFSTIIGKGIFIYNDPPPPHLEDPRIRFNLYNNPETELWNVYRIFNYNIVSKTFEGNFHDYYSLSGAQSFTDFSTYRNYYYELPRHLWIPFPPGNNVPVFDSWKIYLFEDVEVTEVDPNNIDTFCPISSTLNPAVDGDPDFPPGTRLYGVKKVYLAGIPDVPTIVFPDLFLHDPDAGASQIDNILPVVSFSVDFIFVSLFINVNQDSYANALYNYIIDRDTYNIIDRKVLKRNNIQFTLSVQDDNDISEYSTFLSTDARNTKPLEYYQFGRHNLNRNLRNIFDGIAYRASKQDNQEGKQQEDSDIIYDVEEYDPVTNNFDDNVIGEITISSLNIPRGSDPNAFKYDVLSYHLGVYEA